MKVFCPGAVKSAVADVTRAFERDTSNTLEFIFGTVGSLRERALGSEKPDVLVLTDAVLQELAATSHVLRETIVTLGRVGVGIAVGRDVAVPDVSTPETLRKALLDAGSVAYGDPAKGDSSGIHFARVVQQLGIEQALRAKTVLAPLGLAVAELVARGEAEIGATQASVILACEGIKLAGLLPDALQHATTYAAAVMKGSAFPEAARHFVAMLDTPSAKRRFARAGLQQPS